MKTDSQINIISKVKKLREERHLSQAAIANILGISDGQVGNIESYTKPHKYTLNQLYTLSREFNIRIEQLFLEDNDYDNSTNIIDLLIQRIIAYGE